MIYLLQNINDYDYDVRALILAFYEGEKIKQVSRQEFEVIRCEKLEERDIFVCLDFGQNEIRGKVFSHWKPAVEDLIQCNYQDRVANRNAFCRFLYQLLSSFSGKKLPWGTLTGIRPSKIMMKWMEEDGDGPILEQRFMDTYLADQQKASLCRKVALKEKKLLEKQDFEKEYSLYIGIPFCPTTCLYCSFTSFPASRFGDRMRPYLSALKKELAYVAKAMRHKKLSTIYVGGGTPTALSEDLLRELMAMIHQYFPVSDCLEFTVEAGRPDSLTKGKLQALLEAGVQRISINPQTMHQETLALIGRAHTVEQTVEGMYMARELGFDNINMDMITGLPGEDVNSVRETLDALFHLKPESLTVHSLAIKRAANLNIEMTRYRGLVKGSTNEMLRLTDDYCMRMGMEPYYMYRQKNIPGNLENIGYSVPGKECYYNVLIMEEKQDIVACGAGASTKYVYPESNRIERTENVKNLDHYIARIDEMIDRKKRFEVE